MTAFLRNLELGADLQPWPLVRPGEELSDIVDGVFDAIGTTIAAQSIDLVSFQPSSGTIALLGSWAHDGEPGKCRIAALTAVIAQEVRLARPVAGNDVFDRDATMVIDIARRPGAFVVLVVRRVRLAADQPAERRLMALVGMLRRTMDLETRLANAERKAEAALAAVDQERCGVITVTATGRVTFINRAAAALLDRGEMVQLTHNVLRPTHYPDAIRFLAALDTIAHRKAREQRNAMIMLLRGDGLAAPVIASIAPFGSEPATSENEPTAIIHLLQPDGGGHGIAAICALFGLSPIETQLAEHLLQRETLADAAHAMNIKVETARSYLKQIFAKTDTHRQADLLSLISEYAGVARNTYTYIAV